MTRLAVSSSGAAFSTLDSRCKPRKTSKRKNQGGLETTADDQKVVTALRPLTRSTFFFASSAGGPPRFHPLATPPTAFPPPLQPRIGHRPPPRHPGRPRQNTRTGRWDCFFIWLSCRALVPNTMVVLGWAGGVTIGVLLLG